MNCEQILRDQIHEKYLRGELSTEEIAAYEAHLESCVKCRDGLEQEQQLIQGIQSAAKDAMKAEIMQQAETLQPVKKRIDLTVLYKAAAVFLIVALLPGIIYYYNNIEAPQEINSRKISNRIQKTAPAQTEEFKKIDSVLNSIDALDLAAGEKISTGKETSFESDLEMPKQHKVRQKGSLTKQEASAAIVPKTKEAAVVSQMKTKDLDELEAMSGESLSLRSKNRKDAQIRAQASSEEHAPVHLIEAVGSEKQYLGGRYSFIPTVLQNRSKALSKGFQESGYYKSRDGKIKLKVIFEERTENRLTYEVISRSKNLLEMNWNLCMPSGTIVFSDLQYEIKQDSVMQLYRRDSLIYELNLKKQKGSAKYFGN